MRIRKTVAALGIGVLGVAAVSIPPASAVPALGCPYPYVCFYKTKADLDAHRPTAEYKDVTSGWQTLGSRSRGSYFAWNTRNDDIAYFHFTNGQTRCANPNSGWFFGSWVVDKVRISSASHCPSAAATPADASEGVAPTPLLTAG